MRTLTRRRFLQLVGLLIVSPPIRLTWLPAVEVDDEDGLATVGAE